MRTSWRETGGDASKIGFGLKVQRGPLARIASVASVTGFADPQYTSNRHSPFADLQNCIVHTLRSHRKRNRAAAGPTAPAAENSNGIDSTVARLSFGMKWMAS